MKFTGEEACEKLTAKLTANGEKLNISQRTLKHQVETLMKFAAKANEEIELDDFVKDVLDDIKELDGQYRKDHSDFVKDFTEKHPGKRGNGEEGKEEPEIDPAMKTVLEELKSIKEKMEKEEKQKTISRVRGDLKSAMEKKGIKDKEWIEGMMSEISVSEEMNVDEKAESLLKLYNKSKASEGDDHYTLGASSSAAQKKEGSRFDYIQKAYEREQERLKNVK